MQYLNEIFRERAAKAGVRYVDVWDGFVDQQGQFISSGPALDGQTRRLRVSDGVHFTRFGSRKLAHYVELDLVRLFDARVRGPFLPYGVEQGPIVPGTKPIAGPIMPLTTPVGQARGLEGAIAKYERRSGCDRSECREDLGRRRSGCRQSTAAPTISAGRGRP